MYPRTLLPVDSAWTLRYQPSNSTRLSTAVHIAYYFQPGLCVSHIYPQLAATPDFIVYSDPNFSPGRSIFLAFPSMPTLWR